VLELLIVTGGLAAGVGLGWLIARGHGRAGIFQEREALGTRLAAAEALGDELRKQLTQRELDLGELRATLDGERVLRSQAEARWEAARQSVEEQRQLLEEARQRLGESFEALSAEVLRKSGTALIEQARQTIDAQFGRRQEAIDALVKPLHLALDRYETELRALEAKREHAYGSLQEQLRTLSATSGELQREAGNLVTALRAPQIRGRWGEITLRRAVELAGMAKHCDFTEQLSIESDEGRLRPDMVVHLPAGRDIIIDAKVPLAAYLDATLARTPEERSAALARHTQQVRHHVSRLAEKAYWEQLPSTPDLVVMFVPLESAIATALELDASLLEDGIGRKVLVATPVTLMGLLLTIAYGWRQEQVAANAAQISALGRELYDRLRVFTGHFEDVGDKLGKATASYNRAVASMESRVLSGARKLRDLGAATGEEIPPLEAVDTQPRQLATPEIPRQLSTTDPPPGSVP
jgi:DNA recombination protein RmuC